MKRNICTLSIVLFVSVFVCTGLAGEKDSSASKTPVGPKLWIGSLAIDIGLIAVDQQEIKGVIPYMNEGDETLEVTNITGSCDCFAGFEGEKVLAPGEGGELIVKFDKHKIESGPVKRMVRFETNDPANKVVRVNFSFEIERTDSEEIRQLSKDLTAVKHQLHLLRADMRKVLAALNNPRAAAAPSRTRTAAKKPDTNVYDVKIGSSPILGKVEARVSIVAWIDFQCPFSAREYPKLKEILAAYPEQVRLVFKHKPLSFHKKAKPAHALAQMAMQQGGSELFWKMHDRLMAGASKLEISDLREHAGQLKLDLNIFDLVMGAPAQIDKLIEADLAEAKKCNINATPTIMINGLKLVDRSAEAYKARVDDLLKPTANPPQPAKTPLPQPTASGSKRCACGNCG